QQPVRIQWTVNLRRPGLEAHGVVVAARRVVVEARLVEPAVALRVEAEPVHADPEGRLADDAGNALQLGAPRGRAVPSVDPGAAALDPALVQFAQRRGAAAAVVRTPAAPGAIRVEPIASTVSERDDEERRGGAVGTNVRGERGPWIVPQPEVDE